jgi:hypothetical protein
VEVEAVSEILGLIMLRDHQHSESSTMAEDATHFANRNAKHLGEHSVFEA